MASMSLQAAYDQARQWLESNDLNRAIGLAQYILEHYPDNLDAYRILGEAYLAHRQLDRAQEAFERVLRSDPENIPAHVGLGITYERQGRLDHAIPEFEQALEIKPDMPELRSQLLRLYTEAWGSEHAHLRLSRAGLARLYAKGHMLPQAIGEFRQVITDQPDRIDAMVAMAEALWRDGQEDEAIALCRRILAQRPESLKANLVLGYLEMAAGQPEGERAWEAARRMDPYQVVARAVFDTLPPESAEEPSLEEWDEQNWRQRRTEEEQERIAATRPMEAVTPVAIPADRAANGARVAPPPPTSPRAVPAIADSDDFLASLLAINTSPPPAPPPISAPEEEEDLDLGMAPFSLADLDNADIQSPFAPTTTASTARPEADEPALSPFSLSDLGLTDEEVAGLESLNEAPTADTPAAAPEADEPALSPFSLSDLGLTDEEIAGLESGGFAPSEAPAPAAPPPVEAKEPALTPFSLSDLGLTDEEITGLGDMGGEGDRSGGGRPRMPDQAYSAAPDTSDQALDISDLPADLQPFSLDELDLSDEPTPSTGGLGSSLQPFSFDESLPQRPRVSGFMADEGFESSSEEQENISDSGGFSWQQPSQKPQPGFLKSIRSEPEPEAGSIFSKLRQRHDREGPIETPPPPPPPIEAEEHLGLFSMDDIPLRLDQEPAPQAQAPAEAAPPEPEAASPPAASTPPRAAPLEAESLQEAIDSGQVQPFSLADLGLSAEEIAALGLSDAAMPETAAPATPEADAGHDTSYLLDDLETAAPATPEADAGRGSGYLLDDLEPVAPEVTAPDATIEARAIDSDESTLSGELQPFSLADLGLSAEEITALGLDDVSTEPEEPLGSELGITEEELEGLDMGDLSWNQPPPVRPSAEPAKPPMQTTSGDLLVDRLIALGREQGYVDISDIIATFENPEAEADRIEEIGRRLHDAQIEIRDGDEVIDMDAEYTEEEEPTSYSESAPTDSAPLVPEEDAPALTPFSLSELGLSAEEIAALGLGETPTAEPKPTTPPEEDAPALTPFSLSELGLSAEEIAALGLGETPAAEPEPAPAEEEPVMTPFSLSELGLSAEEIAALDLGEAPTAAQEPARTEPEPAPAPAEEEPVMTPFSLSDLGLSSEEIAALGLGETLAEMPQLAEAPAKAEKETVRVEPPAAAAPPSEPPHVPAAPPATPEPASPVVATTPPPAPPDPPPTPAAPARRPAARSTAEAPPTATSGNELLDAYVHRLESDPQNNGLRLSVARAGGQLGMADFALQQYRYLIKQSLLLDQIEDDIQDLIFDADDRQLLRRLHRTLGDIYTKQGRLAEAIDEYSWTPAGS